MPSFGSCGSTVSERDSRGETRPRRRVSNDAPDIIRPSDAAFSCHSFSPSPPFAPLSLIHRDVVVPPGGAVVSAGAPTLAWVHPLSCFVLLLFLALSPPCPLSLRHRAPRRLVAATALRYLPPAASPPGGAMGERRGAPRRPPAEADL